MECHKGFEGCSDDDNGWHSFPDLFPHIQIGWNRLDLMGIETGDTSTIRFRFYGSSWNLPGGTPSESLGRFNNEADQECRDSQRFSGVATCGEKMQLNPSSWMWGLGPKG